MHLWDNDVHLSVRYEVKKAVKVRLCDWKWFEFLITILSASIGGGLGQTVNSQKKTNIKVRYYLRDNPVTQSINPEFWLWFQLTESSVLRAAVNAFETGTMREREALKKQRVLFALALPPVRTDDREGEDGRRRGKAQRDSWSSELDLAGREGLVLHDYGAAGCQNHDVQVLLPLVGLLVPVPGHLCVVGRDQSHLRGTQQIKMRGEEVKEKRDWP